MGLVLGLDISTTATKAVLVDGDGVVRGIGQADYGLSSPRPLWSEQDPGDWWAGAVAAIRAVLGEADAAADEVEAIGLTGQMHGAVLLDASDAVLRPAILWNDQRTAAECELIRDRGWRGATDRDHRQRRAHRLHCAQARLGPGARAGGLGADRPCAAARRTSSGCS